MHDHPVGDRSARQWFIARSIWFTVPGTLVVLGAGYRLVPELADMETAVQRVVLALRWLLVALLPYVAVCLHIATARFFEGSHDPLAGQESVRLKIHCRVMQNTLEQFAWFATALLALATYLTPAQARFVPVACTFFAFARVVYWAGYLRCGTLGRAPGVQLTFTLNLAVLTLALLRFASDILA
jgi:uncharacterized membrane protein YecN with MAPEG domain